MAIEALKKSIVEIPSYPDSNSTDLKSAIATKYNVTENNVTIGNGSTELIYLFAEAFLNAEDSALIPAPSFGEYGCAVKRTGATIRQLNLSPDFHITLKKVVKAIDESEVKVLFLCNPNNPTSFLISKQAIQDILDYTLARNVLVFLDEDFLEFVEFGERYSLIDRIEDFPNLFVLRSFTKIFGLTGLRVGYGIANDEIVAILNRAKIPWNLNCLGQVAAITALKDQEHLQKTMQLVKDEKKFLLEKIGKYEGLEIFPPAANFIFIDVRKTGLKAGQIKNRMLKRGVLIRDCSSFNGLDEYFIRIAVKTRPENEKLLEAFSEAVN